MTRRMTLACAFALALAAPLTACRDSPERAGGESGHSHGDGVPAALPPDFHGPGKLELPDDLRALVVAEMVQVESAMHRMLSALVRGELATVASTARAVHDSFILAQQLTEEQATALTKLLPPEFASLDQRFHQLAGELARAASAGDAVGAGENYARMSESCVGCHRAYARERFTGLAGAAPGGPTPPAPTTEGHGH